MQVVLITILVNSLRVYSITVYWFNKSTAQLKDNSDIRHVNLRNVFKKLSVRECKSNNIHLNSREVQLLIALRLFSFLALRNSTAQFNCGIVTYTLLK